MAVEREDNELSEAVRGLFATVRGELAAVREELAVVKGEVAAAVAEKAAQESERGLLFKADSPSSAAPRFLQARALLQRNRLSASADFSLLQTSALTTAEFASVEFRFPAEGDDHLLQGQCQLNMIE
ncbi:unnamed protein product [Closterium sp. NIES-65]|nr:unnamed protein product [Closterium sp. NIES-65]